MVRTVGAEETQQRDFLIRTDLEKFAIHQAADLEAFATEDEIMAVKQLEKKISEDEALQPQLKNGAKHAVEATFRQVAEDAFEEVEDGGTGGRAEARTTNAGRGEEGGMEGWSGGLTRRCF